jgi:protocatechuate 3,4-dioxygenase beta subunit
VIQIIRYDYNRSMEKGKSATKTVKYAGRHQLTPTTEIEEGPYYKPGSPQKIKLYEEGIPVNKLTLTGTVRSENGEPIPHAWIDFWQADGNGRYDNIGYVLRGHQYTDNSGRYVLETVIPGGYATRTPHIHVKVRASNSSPILTTQLFIPGMSSNKADFLYREELQIDMKDTPNGKMATFNFVVTE